MSSTTCRDEILAALAALGADEFSPADVIDAMHRAGTTYADTTIRTHVVSRMCINAPDHHGTVYGDLERVGPGRYRRVDAWTHGTSGGEADHLTVVPLDASINARGYEVVDDRLGGWLLRLEPIDALAPLTPDRQTPMATLALLSSLADFYPEVANVLREASALTVRFSPAVTKQLQQGSLVLKRSYKGLMATATNPANGRIVEHATVAVGAVTAASLVSTLLPMAIAGAAAYAQQRWLEQTFAKLERALSRIEQRLRDDDLGVLAAADRLVALIQASVLAGDVGPQLRIELAVARQEVERVYLSRWRFVERFKHDLEARQNDHEAKTGEALAWVDDLAEQLADSKRGVGDELVVFLQAMIARARVGTCTAALVAADGDGATAMRLLDQIESELRVDYHDLHNRLAALARSAPDLPVWKRLPGGWSENLPVVGTRAEDRARALVVTLASEMTSTIGSALPDREHDVSVSIPASMLDEA